MTELNFGNHGSQFPNGDVLHQFLVRIEERLAVPGEHGHALAGADAAPHDLPDLASLQLHLNVMDDFLPGHFPADNLFL